MSSLSVRQFFASQLTGERVSGKRILEVGSLNTTQPRRHVESLAPAEYIGTDMQAGYNVDVVTSAEHLVERFGESSFDVVICAEVLEHVQDWRSVINNLKRVVKPGGLLLVTTRSHGFGLHAWPYDFWRYELSDMRAIFADFQIRALLPDPVQYGVFLVTQRPESWQPMSLEPIALYSTVRFARTTDIPAPVQAEGLNWLSRRVRYTLLSEGPWVLLEKLAYRMVGKRYRYKARA